MLRWHLYTGGDVKSLDVRWHLYTGGDVKSLHVEMEFGHWQ